MGTRPQTGASEGTCNDVPHAVAPRTYEPHDVVEALLASACGIGSVSAHMWIADSASSTLRLVAAAGPLSPDRAPVSLDSPLAAPAREGTASFGPVSRIRSGTGEATLYRFVHPVAAAGVRGVVALDTVGMHPPDTDVLHRLMGSFAAPASAALASFVAAQERFLAHELVEHCRELASKLDEAAVVATALESAVSLAKATTGSIMLNDPAWGGLRIIASRGLPIEIAASTVVRPGEGVAGWVFATGQPMVVEDVVGRGRVPRRGIRSALSVPLADNDGIIGVLSVGSRTFPARSTDVHIEALSALARQTTVAIRNARALAASRELHLGTLRALADALERKDPFAYGSSQRVAVFADAIAAQLHVTDAEREAIAAAALLHDLAMDSVGPRALVDGAPLTTVERGLLMRHPVIASELLESIPALSAVAPIVYHHHERYDGSGYASGLAGDAIPLGSRILAVADAFDAMTSKRSYRAAMSPDSALKELHNDAGIQFDPRVVAVFTEIMASQPAIVREGIRSSE